MGVAAKSSLRWPYRNHECKIIHGPGSVEQIPGEMDYLDVTRALVLCGPNAARGRTIERVKQAAGSRVVEVYPNVRPHAESHVVHEVAELVRSRGIDAIVTIGGGSTSDTAKGVTAQLGEGAPIETLSSEFTPPDHYVEKYLKRPKLPIIAIPGTLSGAESAPGFGVTGNNRMKRLFRGDYVAARIIVLDPEATLDTSLPSFLESGGNGLAHGIEGLYSRSRQPMSDAMSVELIRLFVTYLPQVRKQPDDLEPRMQLLYASVLGGMVTTNARMGIHHAVCHCLGARIGLTHGMANSIMLPYSMQFNLDATAACQARAAAAMGIPREGLTDEAAGLAAINRVREFKEELGIPARLGELPTPPPEDGLQQVAEDVMMDRDLYFNPKPVTSSEQVMALLRMAY